MDTAIRVQTLDNNVCVLFYFNAFMEKHESISSPTIHFRLNIRVELAILALLRQPVNEKENSDFKPALLHKK